MPLFRSSPKSPQELVKNLDEALKVLIMTEGGGRKAEKVCESTRVTLSTVQYGGMANHLILPRPLYSVHSHIIPYTPIISVCILIMLELCIAH